MFVNSNIAPILAILELKTERVIPGAQRDGEMLLQARSGRICAPHGPAWPQGPSASQRAAGARYEPLRPSWWPILFGLLK